MKYHLISKKTMRNKDFASLKEQKAGYLQFTASYEDWEHRHEMLFRTPRGWFMVFFAEDKPTARKVVGEVSVTTAQKWLRAVGHSLYLGTGEPVLTQ